jgi:L-asparaginase II
MDAFRVVVRRGGVVEAEHAVHAVAVQEGKVTAAAGDTGLVTLLRSSAKPIQALPLVRAYDDLDSRELAIACASHLAQPMHLEAVRMLLRRARCDEDDLECGPEGSPPARIKHNCSGKHAGMLALCRAHGWRTEGYRLPGHRMQRQNLEDVARAADVAADDIRTATDGCGVVTFALPLDRMARVFASLASSREGPRVLEAMRAHPEYIRGAGATDTVLMQSIPGAVAKGGAEGLICGLLPDGTGFALKAVDGNHRALRAALAAFLPELGHEVPEFAATPFRNSREEVVGEVVLAG